MFHLQYHRTYDSPESRRKTEGPALQKGLDAIASSLNYIGGTIGNALEVGSYVFSCSIFFVVGVRVGCSKCSDVLSLLNQILFFGGDLAGCSL